MRSVRVGEIGIPVHLDQLVELTNLKRKWLGQKPLPIDVTQDSLKISFNSEEYREDLINLSFLGHLQYDILIPYPSTAWMKSVIPDNFCTEVHSVNYYQKINGDCELTHAIEDLFRIVKPEGKAVISVPNFDYIVRMINEIRDDVSRLKWEHFLYSRNVDEKGLFYNQSLCNFSRLSNRARYAGFRTIVEDGTYGIQHAKYLNMMPENFDLPGVNEEARENFQKMLADTSIRRKKCIVPDCPAKAGQQEFRRVQSVYCRRHYRKAKDKLEEMQQKALRLVVVLKKE